MKGLARTMTAGVTATTTALLLMATPSAGAGHGTGGGVEVGSPGACTWGWLCGRIYNRTGRIVTITDDWSRRGDWRSHRSLGPGRNSRDVGTKDADGFWVPAGCTFTAAWVREIPGPRWEKVYDGQYFQITGARC